jgi:hypothetical protein
MYSVLNFHNVAQHTGGYLGYLRFNVTFSGNAGCFKKSFTMGLQMLAVWRVLRKCLHLRAYKVSIVHHVQPPWTMNNLYAFKRKRFRNTRHTAFRIPLRSSFWNSLYLAVGSSGFLDIVHYPVTGSVSILKWGGVRETYSVGPVRKA